MFSEVIGRAFRSIKGLDAGWGLTFVGAVDIRMVGRGCG